MAARHATVLVSNGDNRRPQIGLAGRAESQVWLDVTALTNSFGGCCAAREAMKLAGQRRRRSQSNEELANKRIQFTYQVSKWHHFEAARRLPGAKLADSARASGGFHDDEDELPAFE